MAAGDKYLEREELKKAVLDALNAIEASGTFASFQEYDDLTASPKLHVKGVGDISIPLLEPQARQLISKCRQAPFGRGSGTIVDTSVRNTWELDPTEFSFKNPKSYDAFLNSVLEDVASELGIESPIRAEIYKMLIYEKGAMFKAHQDTEKIPGMFGTLVISLPSAHEGGDVIVQHGGKTKTFKISGTSLSSICWYSDVSHEVLPVTSGYRWVLTYNLTLDPDEERAPAVDMQDPDIEQLDSALDRLLTSQHFDCFYHMLDHDYTEANLSLQSLKTADYARVQALTLLSKERKFDVFLSVIERWGLGNCSSVTDSEKLVFDPPKASTEEGGADWHSIDHTLEEQLRIRKLVEVHGCTVTRDLPIDDDDNIWRGSWGSLSQRPGQSYTGYMGNHTVVVVPHNKISRSLSAGDDEWTPLDYTLNLPLQSCQDIVSYLVRLCSLPDPAESSMDALVKVIRNIWQNFEWSRSHDDAMPLPYDMQCTQDLLKVAIQFGRFDFFEEGACQHYGELPMTFFAWLREWVVDGGIRERFQSVQKGLNVAIQLYDCIDDKVAAVCQFAPVVPSDQQTPKLFLQWARRSVKSIFDANLSSLMSLGRHNGHALPDAALYFDDPYSFLWSKIRRLVLHCIGKTHFLFHLAFLSRLREHIDNNVFGKEVLSVYESITRLSLVAVDFSIGENSGVTPETFLESFNLRETSDVAMLLTKLAVSIPFRTHCRPWTDTSDTDDFHIFWLPFLQLLVTSLDISAYPASKSLVYNALEAYLAKYVGLDPRLADPDRCKCADCAKFNAFLEDESKTVLSWRNKVAHRRTHLQGSLSKWAGNLELKDKLIYGHTWIWDRRLAVAKNQMAMFDAVKLGGFLSEEQYDEIIGVKIDRIMLRRKIHGLPEFDTEHIAVPADPHSGTGKTEQKAEGRQ
ncbi:hypothetical protein QBC35DRAFT_463480 [Podospora australis]|uniref:Prolyl 4-hydroxylase alpha subunit Fe(2+) 2OG dioxygenase domain-containing protein n=1 Tax=Podospora australis TaxID=1536484 RepID=A0AAN6WV44_9PEZI|nr:hypothetical protein QBC35DRAFT_463480 [Podospora australis]